MVVVPDRQDGEVPHLAVREEVDRLSTLEALAVRSGLTVAKQVLIEWLSLVTAPGLLIEEFFGEILSK